MAESVVELIIRTKGEGEGALRKLDAAVDSVKESLIELGTKAKFDILSKKAQEASARVNSIGVASAKARVALKKLDASRLAQLRNSIKSTSTSLNSLARSVGGILATLGAGLGIGLITQEVNEFSLAVAEVSTLVDSTVRSTEELRGDIIATAQEFGPGTTETARALYDIISAGARAGADANKLLAESLVLSTAGVTDARTSADLLTTVINSFGLAAEDATDVSDILFTTVRLGKALDLDTPIPTPEGFIPLRDIKAGDQVFNEVGEVVDVIYAHEVIEDAESYEVVFTDGAMVLACKDHNWLTCTYKDRIDQLRHTRSVDWDYKSNRKRKGITPIASPEVRTTVEMFEDFEPKNKARNKYKYYVPSAKTVEFPAKNLLIDPYLLGAWLGDGATNAARISSVDQEILDQFRGAEYRVTKVAGDNVDYGIRTGTGRSFFVELRELGVLGNKHIPDDYFVGDVNQRLALLRGLMDTDGYASKDIGCCEFTSTLPALAYGVQRLLNSLGERAKVRLKKRVNLDHKQVYRVTWVSRSVNPFLLPRKAERARKGKPVEWIGIESIERVCARPMRCLTVSGDSSLFLVGHNFVVTHNTTIDELASSFSTIAPIASNAQIKLVEITAAIATLTAQGISTSEAMTGLRGAIVGLTKTSAAQKAVQDLGFASFSAAAQALGFQGALQAVIDSAEGSEAQLLKLFGRVEGLNAALSLTGRNTERFNRNLEAFENRAGAAAAAADKVRESAGRQFEEAINRLKDSFLALEPVIQEIATQILPQIGAALGTVSVLIAENKDLVILLTEALLALATIGIAANILGILVPLAKFKKAADIAVKAAVSLGTALNFAPLINLSTKAVGVFALKLGVAAAVAVGVGLAFKGWLEGIIESDFALERAKERLDALNQSAEIGRKQLEALGAIEILTPQQLGTLAFQEATEELEAYEQGLEKVLRAERLAAANLTGGPEFEESQDRIQAILVSLAATNEALKITGRTLEELPKQAEGFISALDTEVEGIRNSIRAANDGFITLDTLLATLSTSTVRAAEGINQSFVAAKQAGELLTDTAGEILKEFLQLNNLDLEALESVFRGVTKVGKEESAALFLAYEGVLEKLSDEDLQQFLDIATSTFEDIAGVAIVQAAIVEEAFGRALDDLGIDFGLATRNIRDDILDLAEQFGNLADRFKDAGVDIDQQARAVAQAISNLRLQSSEEFFELRKQLENAFGEDFLNLGPVKEALEGLVPPIREVEEAAKLAKVSTEDWNNSIGNLKEGLDSTAGAAGGLKQEAQELAASLDLVALATQDVDLSLDSTISDLKAAGASMDELNRAALKLAQEQANETLPGGSSAPIDINTEATKKNTSARKENTEATKEGAEAQESSNQVVSTAATLQLKLVENFAKIKDSGGNAAKRLEEFQKVLISLEDQPVTKLIAATNKLSNQLAIAANNAKQAFADAEAGLIPMAVAIGLVRKEAAFLDAQTLAKLNKEVQKLTDNFNNAKEAAAAASVAASLDIAEAQGDEEGVLRAQSAEKILALEALIREAKEAGNLAAVIELKSAIQSEQFALILRLRNLKKVEKEEALALQKSNAAKSKSLTEETQAKVGALNTVADEEVKIAKQTMERIAAIAAGGQDPGTTGSLGGVPNLVGRNLSQPQFQGFNNFGNQQQTQVAPAAPISLNFFVDGSDLLNEDNIRRKVLPVVTDFFARQAR